MPVLRYLALGDSYTIGESVSEDARWPNQLAKMLESQGIQTEVKIIARTGWTTDELWQGMQAAHIEPPYGLVSLLIGVNNQYRGHDLNAYRDQFVFLLSKGLEYANGNSGRVLVLSIPDWGVTPFASDRDREQIRSEIEAFNRINREEAEKAGVHYVDVTHESREAVSDAALIASDGLHPSEKMYSEWARLAYPKVLKAIGISK